MKAEYGRSLRKQLDHFPVWDIGTKVELGDYGLIEDDCFSKHGNIIEEYQSLPQITSSKEPAFWEFTSVGTKKTSVTADASVPAVGAQAKIELAFSSAYSLFLLAADSYVSSISNLREVARALHTHPSGWVYKYAIVSSVRKTSSLVLLMNTSQHSTITVTADPGVLAQFQAGRVNASSKLEVSGDAGLKSFGESGAVYADLVRVRRFGGAAQPADHAVADAAVDPYEPVQARVE